MKALKLSLAVALSIATLFSCKQETPQDPKTHKASNEQSNEQNDDNSLDGYTATKSEYLFTNIVIPRAMTIKPSKHTSLPLKDSTCERTSLNICFQGDMKRLYNIYERDAFCDLVKAKGVTPNGKVYTHVTPADNITTSRFISDVQVTTLTDYDASHPAGSSLSDIVMLDYIAFDQEFDETIEYQDYNGAPYRGLYSVKLSDPFTTIKHPAVDRRSSTGENKYDCNTFAMAVKFTKAPATTSQKIRVKITFDNGDVFQQETTVEIVEIS